MNNLLKILTFGGLVGLSCLLFDSNAQITNPSRKFIVKARVEGEYNIKTIPNTQFYLRGLVRDETGSTKPIPVQWFCDNLKVRIENSKTTAISSEDIITSVVLPQIPGNYKFTLTAEDGTTKTTDSKIVRLNPRATSTPIPGTIEDYLNTTTLAVKHVSVYKNPDIIDDTIRKTTRTKYEGMRNFTELKDALENDYQTTLPIRLHIPPDNWINVNFPIGPIIYVRPRPNLQVVKQER